MMRTLGLMGFYRITTAFVFGLSLLIFTGCGDGDTGPAGATGAAGTDGTDGTDATTDTTVIAATADLPGTTVAITGVTSSTSSPNGRTTRAVNVGEYISVTFTLAKADGTAIALADLDRDEILLAGPTSNYQLIFSESYDEEATANADGSYTFTFPSPLPTTYPAQLNDTDSFDADNGDLKGQALLSGTYTVGIRAAIDYDVDGNSVRDLDIATADFLVGTATTIAAREVVTNANCDACHSEVRIHGGGRADVKYCVLCHTNGSEDKNVADAAGGTPGVTIDFATMIHKIHNGASLPSVGGVATNADGSRNYAATKVPYQVVGYRNSVHDYSEIVFPVFPNLYTGLPKDVGYDALTGDQQDLEDDIRSGAATCAKCHGDPDGDGPLAAPAQGSLAYSNPTRDKCGSCHDDIDWAKPYAANSQIMPAQTSDDACALCHPASGNSLAVQDGHLHPLLDSTLNTGINFATTAVNAGANINAGDNVAVTCTIQDDAGAAAAPAGLDRLNIVIAGPTSNLNVLLNWASTNTDVIQAILGAGPTHTFNLPEAVVLEFVGDGNAAGGQVLTTDANRVPHLNVGNVLTTVYQRTAVGAADMLNGAAEATQNYVDVDTPGDFADGNIVVIDDGAAGEEYLEVALVSGSRLFFNSALRNAHADDASISVVTLTELTGGGTDYTLAAATGTITTVGAIPATDAVVVSYTGSYVAPATFPATINESPDVGADLGKWRGKAVVDGTYLIGVWGEIDVDYTIGGQNTDYNEVAPPNNFEVLVGAATTKEPYALISSSENCDACHNEYMLFHGGHRRGFDTCILCHAAGTEDWPNYKASSFAPPPIPANPTVGVTIDFRTMLHKIHMGADLDKKDTYGVNGYQNFNATGTGAAHTYEEVHFPILTDPGAASACVACHGSSNNSWKAPAARVHTDGTITKVWKVACTSCHDSDVVMAHVDANTAANGAESCELCHGDGDDESVETKHKNR